MNAGAHTLEVKVNPRARRISVRVDPTRRTAILTLPRERDYKAGAAFARERAQWIADALAALPEPMPFEENAEVPVLGAPCRLIRSRDRGVWSFEPGPPAVLDAPSLPDAYAGRVKRALTAMARKELVERSHRYADHIDVTIKRITVRDTRSRWGSCAPDGSLNFSWRLICAPIEVLDYVAAHEVAHLVEANHGPRFWRLVERLFGDHDAEREWLRAHGPGLHAVGAAR